MNRTYATAYRSNALASSNGLHLVITLYDAAGRFLNAAADACARADAAAMQDNARRAIAIVVHLQARLNAGVDAQMSASLSEFYAAVLALVLEGVRANRADRLRAAEDCMSNVRSAWSEAARGPAMAQMLGGNASRIAGTGWSA